VGAVSGVAASGQYLAVYYDPNQAHSIFFVLPSDTARRHKKAKITLSETGLNIKVSR